MAAEFEAARQGPGAPAGHLDGLDLLRLGTIFAHGGFPAFGAESVAASEQMTRLAARLAGQDGGFRYTAGPSRDGGSTEPDSDAPLTLTSDSTSSSGDGGEIVVIGIRPPDEGSGGGGIGGGGGLGDPTSPDEEDQNPGLGEEPALSPDCSEANFEAGLGVTFDDDERENIETIGAALNALLEGIGALPANGKFVSSTGETIFVYELYSLLVSADWTITDQPQNNAPTAELSTGAAIRNGGDPLFILSERGLMDHGENSFQARAYILHELSHVTAVGDQRNTDAHYSGGGTSTEEWRTNEQWANSLAAAIANAIEQPLTNWPGLGGSFVGFGSVTFTYVPPAHADPQTAADAYQGCGGTA